MNFPNWTDELIFLETFNIIIFTLIRKLKNFLMQCILNII
jgi:hypothetical protein